MSFIRSEIRRKEFAARFGTSAGAPPAASTAQRSPKTIAAGCRVCGSEHASHFFRDHRFCRAHCPWTALVAAKPPLPAPSIIQAPKRRRILPTADLRIPRCASDEVPPSPTSVYAITPSSSDVKMWDDMNVSTVSVSPPASPLRGKRFAATGFDGDVKLVG